MKKIIILIIVVLNIVTYLYSQNREPEKIRFAIDTSISQPNTISTFSTYLNDDINYFKINEFMLGFHWGSNWKITEAMKMGQAHVGSTIGSNTIAHNTRLIINPSYIMANAGANTIMQAQAVQYEPTLEISASNPERFTTNYNDTTNSIFGFRFIHKDVKDVGTTNSLILKQDGGYNNEIVLSEPWINDVLYFNSSF